jgi:hypothetical protein
MHFNAVHTLRRVGDGHRNQFSVFSRDFPILSCDHTVERSPCLKFGWRERFHIAKKFQIVFIVVMTGQRINTSFLKFDFCKCAKLLRKT